jgi:hypothetical protein
MRSIDIKKNAGTVKKLFFYYFSSYFLFWLAVDRFYNSNKLEMDYNQHQQQQNFFLQQQMNHSAPLQLINQDFYKVNSRISKNATLLPPVNIFSA